MLWYAQQTTQNGWSRSVLKMWIESNLYSRQGKAINNFKQNLKQIGFYLHSLQLPKYIWVSYINQQETIIYLTKLEAILVCFKET